MHRMYEQQSLVLVPSIHSPFSVANRVKKQKREVRTHDRFLSRKREVIHSLVTMEFIVPCTHPVEPRLNKERGNLEYASVGQQMGRMLPSFSRCARQLSKETEFEPNESKTLDSVQVVALQLCLIDRYRFTVLKS